MQSRDDRNCDQGRNSGAEQPVLRDRVRRRAAEIVRHQRHDGRPNDPARRVPREEAPPLHAGETGDPRSRNAQPGDEPREEDRLAAVLLEEALSAWDHAVAEPLDDRVPLEESTTKLAAE